MKKLRLVGLALVLTLTALAHTRPALAFCTGPCTSDDWCHNCTRIPDSFCLNGICAE